MFKNPLISPDILGVSSGAGFGASVAILFSLSMLGIQLSAFAFGLTAVFIALALSRSISKLHNQTLVLLLSGIITGSMFGAFISLTKYLADAEYKLPDITFWLMGSLTNITNEQIMIVAPIVLLAIIPLYLSSWKLNVLSFGEDEASSMGVQVSRLRFIVILSATLLTATVVSITGLIGWIGLVVPHIARFLIGSDNRWLLPSAFILGGMFLLLIDLTLAHHFSLRNPLGHHCLYHRSSYLFLCVKIGKKQTQLMGIITNNLTIGYQNPVLSDVNLSVNKGEILCVLGKNGSGKTTLFKTLLGLLPKLSGEILLDDQPFDFSKKQENAKKIAYIPQARKIDFSFTAFEVVLFGRTPHLPYFGFPSKKDKEIATETMAQIGILSLKDKVFSQMSGGEQQLTIIARALTQEPEYIVMDEPTSALDFGNQIKVIQQIKSLQNKYIGIVLSTHNPDHVFLCNSKVAVVKDGRLAVTGTPKEVMSEALLKSLYDIDMKIIDIEGRKVCFPYTLNH